MALSASWQPDGAPERRGRARPTQNKAIRAAHRHSRRVFWLRVLLPVIGTAAVVGFLVVTQLGLPGDLDLSAARLSVTKNAVIMDRPHLTGFDGERREYIVSADRAIQALASPDKVKLEAIEATIKTAGQGTTRVVADTGDYDHTAQTLHLAGSIAVQTGEGYTLHLTDADIDFKAGTMKSDNATKVDYGDSTVASDRLAVSDNGKLIVFDGSVRTTILPPKRAAQPAAADTQ